MSISIRGVLGPSETHLAMHNIDAARSCATTSNSLPAFSPDISEEHSTALSASLE